MTSKGWDDVRAVGVATVIDLRNEVERGRSEVHPVVGPGSWTANLRLFPAEIARVLTAIADAGTPLLIHCAGGRDRTGMIGSMLLALADATPESIVANYEAGFRGAALHRGHWHAHSAEPDGWLLSAEQQWTEEELNTALADRRRALREWVEAFDVAAYLLDSGVSEEQLRRLKHLLVG